MSNPGSGGTGGVAGLCPGRGSLEPAGWQEPVKKTGTILETVEHDDGASCVSGKPAAMLALIKVR